MLEISRKRPKWVCIKTPRMKRLCFKLKWEIFARHCFGCAEWDHFMADCQCHCSSALEVPNEGVGRDVGMLGIMVVMDEGT